MNKYFFVVQERDKKRKCTIKLLFTSYIQDIIDMNTKIMPRYCDQSYDPRMMQHMTFRNQITDPIPTTDPEIHYEIERHFLFISSTMRERSQYLDPAHFRVTFREPFKDVVSVELSAGVLPNQGNISSDAYVLLDIPELNHIRGGDGSSCFGILGLQSNQNRDFYNLDKANTNDMPVVFRPVKSRFDAMTIILRHPDGSQVQFGDEDPNVAADFNYQTQLTFEIRTRVRKRVGIDRDSRASPYTLENMYNQKQN